MTPLHLLLFTGVLFLASCASDSQRNKEGGLKEEACAISRELVTRKVNNKHINFGPCVANEVNFFDNSRYEVNSYIELPELSGKFLRYNYYVVLIYKGSEADKIENWNVEKIFIEVFAN